METRKDAEQKITHVKDALYQKNPGPDNKKIFEALRVVFQEYSHGGSHIAEARDCIKRTLEEMNLDKTDLDCYHEDLNYAFIIFSLDSEAHRLEAAAYECWFEDIAEQLSDLSYEISCALRNEDVDVERAYEEYQNIVQGK